MAKVTFYKEPDGRIVQETKEYGKIERKYVTKEQMDNYETGRNAFAGVGCLAVFLVLAFFWFSSQW